MKNSIKCRVTNRFGASVALKSPDDIAVKFPYTSADELEKTLARGGVKILDDEKGEFEVMLSDFEIQGLPEGNNQTFDAVIKRGSIKTRVRFTRSLHVHTIESKDLGPRKILRGGDEA